MSSSRPQSHSNRRLMYTEDSQRNSSVPAQQSMQFERPKVLPGSFDDSAVVRGVLIQAIKKSGLSRAAIAEEMSFLLGRSVTEKMLYAFTAESRDDRRWPGDFDRAFCRATGDDTLLSFRAEMAGLHVITQDERTLMELGRQYLIRTQADEQIAILQRRMHGRVA